MYLLVLTSQFRRSPGIRRMHLEFKSLLASLQKLQPYYRYGLVSTFVPPPVPS